MGARWPPNSPLRLQADDISRLYRDHAKSLLVFLARRVYDPEVAMDLLAETFASAFVVRDQFRGQDDPDAVAWLYGIARNQLRHFYRRGQAQGRGPRAPAPRRRPLAR